MRETKIIHSVNVDVYQYWKKKALPISSNKYYFDIVFSLIEAPRPKTMVRGASIFSNN